MACATWQSSKWTLTLSKRLSSSVANFGNQKCWWHCKKAKKIATWGLLNSTLHESLFGQQFSKDKIPFLQEDLGGYFYVKPDSDPIAQICQGEDDFTCCFGMWQWASMAAMSIYTQVWPQVGDGREKKVKHSRGEPPDDDERWPQMRGVTRRQRRHLSSKLGWPTFLCTNTWF